MRRRDDAHVRPDLRLAAADGQHFLPLEHAEQLHLHRQRDVGEFVEEHGAAVGEREQARRAACSAPVNAPSDVAEQFALDEVRVQRRDVDGQERLAAPRAVGVDRAGDEFLAGAALAGDEHARVGRGDQRDPLEDGLHRRAAADDRVRVTASIVLSSARALAPGSPGRVRRPLRGVERLVEVERLGEVVERAALDGLDGGVQVAVRGDDDDRRRRGDLPAVRRAR